MNGKDQLPISQKYALTINEAAKYFNIGTKRMRRLAEENLGRFAAFSGNRYLILRPKFEEFLQENPIIDSEGREGAMEPEKIRELE